MSKAISLLFRFILIKQQEKKQMGIFLVTVLEKAKLQTSYLVDLSGKAGQFDPKQAVQLITEGKAEQFDSDYQGNTGEIEITSHVPFGIKALKSFKEKIKPYIEQEKDKAKIARDAKKASKKTESKAKKA